MKRILFAAAAIAALGMSTHAFAQTATGTITVNGTVTAACTVVTGGTAGGSAFGGSINLNEIDNTTTGFLRTDLEGVTPVSGASLPFQINCNSGNPTVDLVATRFSTTGTSGGGYSANVDYTADVIVSKAGGGTKTYSYTTAAVAAAHTNSALGDRLANIAGNIVVDARSFAAENGASSILDAGTYTSTITVQISPTS